METDVKQKAEQLERAAKDALAVQDASNLCGVLNTLLEHVRANRGRAMRPIITLFLSKLASLNGSDCLCSRCLDAYAAASREVERLAGKDGAA